MSRIYLESKSIPIDGNTRMEMERAKKAARVDYSYTCFKGKTRFTKSQLAVCMWLSQEKLKEEYV